MPLQETSGNATADAYGGGATAVVANYIEDVFSTWLYTGNASTQTITNNIDLAGKGGLLWIKSRTNPTNGTYHFLYDNVRGQSSGYYNSLASNTYDSSNIGGSYPGSYYGGVNSFNADGFTLATPGNGFYFTNSTSGTYASWTFRKQPKFFDVVTYTGTGVARTIAHNLGSVPGSIWVKRTDANGDWQVYHRSLANTQYLVLNDTAAAATGATRWNSTTPTSSVFSLGTDATVNASGGTYIAYIFAHNAGGFGLTGTDNVISCGSFTTDGSGNATASLGYEPQWIIFKSASGSFPVDGWHINDNMRGWSQTINQDLTANTSSAESAQGATWIKPNATGFSTNNTGALAPTTTYIYIAIRRGPMKVPTDATKVFSPVARTGTGTTAVVTGASSPPDLAITKSRTNASNTPFFWYDRLRGTTNPLLESDSTSAEQGGTNPVTSFNMNGVTLNDSAGWGVNMNAVTYINYFLQRAPSFFDEICCTQTTTVNHNLGVTPELVIYKTRSAVDQWYVCTANAGFGIMNLTTGWVGTAGGSGLGSSYANATSTTINGGTAFYSAGVTLVAYLFATCAGVSKVGSYSGTGATQTIDCGFTGGARFVLIKRTNGLGDWYVWDTARGMTSGTDPSLLLNSTAAEVNANSIYTTTGGFQIVSTAAGINGNGDQFVYWAIA